MALHLKFKVTVTVTQSSLTQSTSSLKSSVFLLRVSGFVSLSHRLDAPRMFKLIMAGDHHDGHGAYKYSFFLVMKAYYDFNGCC